MILYFLRHGLAEERFEWVGNDDLRPLTTQGIKNTGQSAEIISLLDLDLELIITSPLVRAYQTAEIVAKRLQMLDRLVKDARVGPGFGINNLDSIFAAHPGISNIMFVGHEPDFSQIVSDLIGGGNIIFKKGGLARVELSGPPSMRGELAWLIPPRILRS